MSQLWGFAAGQQAAQEMQQRQSMTNMALAEEPAKLQHMNIVNKSAELALHQQEMFAQMMEKQYGRLTNDSSGSKDPLGDQMRMMTQMALDSGNPQMAAKYMDSYSRYESNKARIADNQSKLAIAHAQVIDKLMSGVHDENSWKAANAAYMLETGKPSPFTHISYAQAQSSGLLDRLKAATLSAVQKSLIKKNNAQANLDRISASLAPKRKELIERQTQEVKDRDRALHKEGHVVNAKAMNENLKVLGDLANAHYQVDPNRQAAVRAILRPWAERMTEVERENPGMTETQVAQKVFNEARQAKAFAGFQDFRGIPGQTSNNAIPYKAGMKDLQNNMWYRSPSGQTALYKDGKFYSEQEVQTEQVQ
jgi:hypothetical protein